MQLLRSLLPGVSLGSLSLIPERDGYACSTHECGCPQVRSANARQLIPDVGSCMLSLTASPRPSLFPLTA